MGFSAIRCSSRCTAVAWLSWLSHHGSMLYPCIVRAWTSNWCTALSMSNLQDTCTALSTPRAQELVGAVWMKAAWYMTTKAARSNLFRTCSWKDKPLWMASQGYICSCSVLLGASGRFRNSRRSLRTLSAARLFFLCFVTRHGKDHFSGWLYWCSYVAWVFSKGHKGRAYLLFPFKARKGCLGSEHVAHECLHRHHPTRVIMLYMACCSSLPELRHERIPKQ